ncbi:DUF2785 domain-containing protein [Lactiplantibacillus mudanjiangensis]|uniref:DUF2785 domain-containing protein n=1 Tax=Lactiplantibacillus mudanjiangensis TaxID=1296538 RepID=A0A660EA62_9LACO|nr:DUF2785 domain-containing protein [Lactiplantibacillus mudanjiangensis]VDG19162.1 hypothetical protein [Lactobacillus sp. CBA3605] [Lactiplantibacillus mudanjiangensis]VDG25673.1 hypothetical protein [Lactobacillus sp. CBA3605] [Lactiplantibacillus mudanjiangensis]VDG29930.1 hypothetical protein [Lactobacillus sp. CBA3605] [Lactiplantibacillus mudanjiangensis]VDG33232.1 hypothetical protein [Lactobacillus sp. CBA3605] [Lactiplantibacillus mudanjiangensis]
MDKQKLTTLKANVLQLRQHIRAGDLYQSLPQRIGYLINQIEIVPATTVIAVPDGDVLTLINQLHKGLDDGTLREITDEQLMQLLPHLGSLNPAIRDSGCYYLINEAFQQQLLSNDQLGLIFDTLIQDQQLFAHIDEPENDAIYQRSFTVLILAILLYADHASFRFMTTARLEQLVQQFTVYLMLERDTRGFIGTNGWAHAYTHIGNLLEELGEDARLTRADKLMMLATLIERYQRLDQPLIFGEPERLSSYLAMITSKDDVYTDYLLMALKRWHQQLVMQPAPKSEVAWTRIFNRNRLLEAMALHTDFPTDVSDYLDEELEFLG